MNHLSDNKIEKYGLWAFQNRIDSPQKTFRTQYTTIRRLKWFVHKKCVQKKFFLKNRPIFSISLSIWHQPFQRSKHDVWALYWLYFPWYHTLPSLLYLHVFTPLWICKPQEKSRLVQNSLKYLSDHLSNVLKWKYASSAF